MAQELKTVIVLGGRVDNTFTELGDKLITMGSQIEAISRPMREFLKDSVMRYADYDELMREAQAVGEFSNAEMKALDELNQQVAKGSIFTRAEAAQAEVFLGQLGLSVKEITTLLPSVLRLSQAGNLDLADSVDYLYSSLMSLNLGMDEAQVLTDMLAKTAAIGATDVDTLGKSLTRIGSGLQLFKGGAPEVLTILSAVSKFGEDMRGLTGGTQMRNFALSLVAPTGAGKQLQAALENFSMTRSELDDYFDKEGIDLTSAAAAMEKLGLKVFDEQGNMRGMLDIISEMRTALAQYDEERRAQFLREVFGRRGYVTAENLLRVTDQEYADEMAKILDSEGFAQSMADTMQGGIGGAIRQLEASMDNLKLTIGATLAPTVQDVADNFTSIVNSLSDMDEGKLKGLLDGAIAIGGAGAAMMTTGMALRMMGYLLTPQGLIAAGLVTLAALVLHLNRLKNEEFKGNFGDLELDMQSLEKYANSLGDTIDEELKDIVRFREGVDAAVESYKTASAELSQSLITKALTGATLTEDDQEKLQDLGTKMYESLVDGINNSYAATMSYIELLWGEEANAENDAYSGIIGTLEHGYNRLTKAAEDKSKEFRKALSSAFEDGALTTEERENIMSILNEYNSIMAQMEDRNRFVELETLMRKAQSASWDSVTEYADNLEQLRKEKLEAQTDQYERARAETKWNFLEDIKSGAINQATGKPYTQADMDDYLAEMDRQQQERIAQTTAAYNDALIDIYDTVFSGSDFGDAWKFIKQLYSEGIPLDDFNNFDFSGAGLGERITEQLAEQLSILLGEPGFLGGGLGLIDDLSEVLYGRLGVYEDMHEGTRKLFEMLWMARQLQDAIEKASQGGSQQPPTAGEMFTPVYEQMELPPIDIFANTEPAETAIKELNGTQVEVNGIVDRAAIQSQLQRFPFYIKVLPLGLTGGISGGTTQMTKYAEGGRADEPSLFGEAGPEWAIPEAHNRRTADLLNAARKASGFSWGELMARAGAASTVNVGGSTQITYSPTIIAQDADGVENKLREDKRRFQRWFDDYTRREALEVYA